MTRVASCGRDGVASALAERPDVILLDVMMPDVDGLGTLELLRADPATATILVIFMTAKAQKSDVTTYLDAGAIGVITKPFDPMSLAATSEHCSPRSPRPEPMFAESSPQAPAPPAESVVDDALRHLWEQAEETFRQRVDACEHHVALALMGDATHRSREEARHGAHKLAGTLGMFGVAGGSALALELEGLIEEHSESDRDRLERMAEIVLAIRDALDDRGSTVVDASSVRDAEAITREASRAHSPVLVIVTSDRLADRAALLRAGATKVISAAASPEIVAGVLRGDTRWGDQTRRGFTSTTT